LKEEKRIKEQTCGMQKSTNCNLKTIQCLEVPKKDEDSVELLGKEVKVSDLQGKKERKKTRERQKSNLLLLVVSC
jgi:hypothetical protein